MVLIGITETHEIVPGQYACTNHAYVFLNSMNQNPPQTTHTHT
jgi:hypothetical protein